MLNPTERYTSAIARFDALNAEDPHRVDLPGEGEVAKELLYARHMTSWLARLEPEASEPLWLAVRAQHLCRWRLPRQTYPAGRQGYKEWRTACAKMHAELAGEAMGEAGYGPGDIGRVKNLIEKKRIKVDAEAQTLEDVACLVFLEHYLQDFADQHDEAKVVEILKKTWIKMSERGREAALGIAFAERERRLVERALA